MGFRFRKSKSLFGGAVRLSAGKKSGSISIGAPGSRVTFSTTGRRTTTIGLPGTGLSYSTSSSTKAKRRASAPTRATRAQAAQVRRLAAELEMEMGELDPATLTREGADQLIAAMERMKVDPEYRRQVEAGQES